MWKRGSRGIANNAKMPVDDTQKINHADCRRLVWFLPERKVLLPGTGRSGWLAAKRWAVSRKHTLFGGFVGDLKSLP
jgi:hypothetical protein